LRVAAVLLLLVVLAGIGALGWLVVAYPSTRVQSQGRTVAVAISTETTLADVAAQLAAAGLIEQPRVFTWFARVLGAEKKLRRGRVLVTDAMSARELLQRIAIGYGATNLRITIPEGFNRFDIADRLADWGVCERADFLAATTDPALLADIDPRAKSAEGYLFPDTYELRDGTTGREVVRRMLDNMRKRLLQLLDAEATALGKWRAELGFGVYEMITLASIVEKEAHIAAEQAVIAGVFWNRLRDPNFKPRRMQADPTVAYGCLVQTGLPSCAAFDKKRVTRLMTADPANLYNTYRHDGLPPGPIANPGLRALRAALVPAQHGHFYFVASGGGRHAFSASLDQHNQAVQQARATTP
jgi:UPF0755 protein